MKNTTTCHTCTASDTEQITAALALILAALPTATVAQFETDDQTPGAGFLVREVFDASGETLAYPGTLRDDLWELISDVRWNGVVPEDRRGFAYYDFRVQAWSKGVYDPAQA